VESNSIVKSSLKAASSVPMMHNENQTVVIRHREYLGEIRSTQNFAVNNSYPLNPGSSVTFPWLSTIAASFQEYRFRGVVFHYIPTSGSAVSGTSPSLGSVMLQTSYRATDVPPSSKVEMLNEYCANEVVPSDAMAHPIECAPLENPFNILYVRTGQVPTGDTKLMYDLGVTHLCTSGQLANGNVIGDLWVTYEVELKKPLVSSNATSQYQSGSVWSTGTMTGISIFDGTDTYAGNLEFTAVGNLITFPKGAVGNWQLVIHLTPTTNFTTVSWALPPVLGNCQFVKFSPASAYHEATTTAGTTPTTQDVFYICAVRISDPAVQATVDFQAPVLGGTVASTACTICPTGMY
jgi:hypothetical protein